LRKVQESNIICESVDSRDDSRIEFGLSFGYRSAIFGEMLDDSRERNGVTVKSGLVEPFMFNLGELGFGSSLEEGIKLTFLACTLIKDLWYEFVDLLVLKPLLAILPPLMRSIPVCDNY